MTILIQTNFIDKVVTRYNLDVYSNTTNEQQCMYLKAFLFPGKINPPCDRSRTNW